MANRQSRSVLKQIAQMLREESDVPKERGGDSLDVQVDRYLSEYESEARSTKNEAGDWRRTCRRLFEADDDEGDDKKKTAKDDDASDAPKKMSDGEIAVDSFASSVIRLIDNYDSLLEVKNTILRRAVNFLSKNYDVDVTNEFKDAIRDQYGIEIGKSNSDVTDDEFPAPSAGVTGSPGGE